MGLAHSPRIVTDGLVLLLDAGNTKSYPGSGTTWSDLSGNGNNGTLTNGPTYSSDNGGSIVFDGSNDYVESSSAPTGISASSGLTLEAITKVDTNANPTSWVWVNPHLVNNSGSWVTGLLWNGGTNNFRAHLRTTSGAYNPDTPTQQFFVADAKKWNYYVQVYDGSNILVYVNGKLFHTFTGYSGTLVNISNIVTGAWKDPNLRITNAQQISYTSVYNRGLSASEVQQNFNALRGRFGI